jgi:hypothetical protein
VERSVCEPDTEKAVPEQAGAKVSLERLCLIVEGGTGPRD